MIVLGIESTCDDTSVALVRSGRQIISLVTASQAATHNRFGGVVPELASRGHIDSIIPTLDTCLEQAHLNVSAIDLLAVAKGPGLIGSLLTGIQTAKALAWALGKPLVGVNHVEAHLYAATMGCKTLCQYFPALGVVLSGGHTTLVQINSIGDYRLIGQTVDDALGEAFDKVAKLLHLGYPGGPQIEKLAALGNPDAYPFHSGRVKGRPFSFSFSGLKTAVLYTYQSLERQGALSEQVRYDVCASFQKAAFQDVLNKVTLACEAVSPKAIFIGGGVSQNRTLRHIFEKTIPLPVFWPSSDLCQDNAAMIAGLGFHVWNEMRQNEVSCLDAVTRIAFA